MCFTNRLEETACKTGIDHRHFLECIDSVLSVTFLLFHIHTHKYANHLIGIPLVGICIIA